jgi:hypothetical protein
MSSEPVIPQYWGRIGVDLRAQKGQSHFVGCSGAYFNHLCVAGLR